MIDWRAHSWVPLGLTTSDLAEPEPPTIGGGLIYPGRRHLFMGETESLKSWAALVACAEEIAKGETVVYVDFEMGPAEILSRLRALGLDDASIDERFIYVEPSQAIGSDPAILADLAVLLAGRKPSLVIFDAYEGVSALHELDPDKGRDVEQLYRCVIEPFRAHGAATGMVDHVTKNAETRGRYAIGSQRKLAAVDVALSFMAVQPFGRGRTGKATITVAKDRPGFLSRPLAAELTLHSSDTGRITWAWTIAEQAEEGEPKAFRPTYLMERVSRHVELLAEPASRTAIETTVKGNAATVRLAIDTLTRENYLTEKPGARGARLVHSKKPYREADDNPTPSTPSDPVLTPSETGSPTTSSTPSSPLLEDGVTRTGTGTTNGHDPVHPDDERLIALAREVETSR